MQYSLFAGDVFETAERDRQSKAKNIQEKATERTASAQEGTEFHSRQDFHNNSEEKSNLF